MLDAVVKFCEDRGRARMMLDQSEIRPRDGGQRNRSAARGLMSPGDTELRRSDCIRQRATFVVR